MYVYRYAYVEKGIMFCVPPLVNPAHKTQDCHTHSRGKLVGHSWVPLKLSDLESSRWNRENNLHSIEVCACQSKGQKAPILHRASKHKVSTALQGVVLCDSSPQKQLTSRDSPTQCLGLDVLAHGVSTYKTKKTICNQTCPCAHTHTE